MHTRKIILDTETTGLDPQDGHRIVEIGAIEMINQVLTGNKFHFYINPEREMPAEAYRIHGISSEFLKDKPLFRDIADDFLAFIGDSKLVIHNAAFDLKFLNHELALLSKEQIDSDRAIDTLLIARKMFPGTRVNLDALCKKFKVDNSARKFHGALKDAALLSEVYVQLSGGRQGSFHIAASDAKGSAVNLQKRGNAKSMINNVKIQAPTEEERQRHKDFLKDFSSNSIWAIY